MMKSKEEIISLIEEAAQIDESVYGAVLTFVAKKWDKIVEAERARRDSVHARALLDMFDNIWATSLAGKRSPKLWSNVECCTSLDAAASLFPDGKGRSEAQRQTLQHLATSCRQLGWTPQADFIREIRKQDKFLEALYRQYPEQAA